KSSDPKNRKPCGIAAIRDPLSGVMKKVYRAYASDGAVLHGAELHLLDVLPHRKEPLFTAMRRDKLKADGKFFAVALYGATRHRYRWHARKIDRYGEDICRIHGERVRCDAEFPRRYRARGERDNVHPARRI